MCGIAGFLNLDGTQTAEALSVAAQSMACTLRHRGPDDEGVWVDSDSGIALAHRRLSILDLSPAGHQPMISESGRYVISYNGEIYNFAELRRKLEQEAGAKLLLRGRSDTEGMLACFERWGIEESLARWNGMFAFAVWDRKKRALFLARDGDSRGACLFPQAHWRCDSPRLDGKLGSVVRMAAARLAAQAASSRSRIQIAQTRGRSGVARSRFRVSVAGFALAQSFGGSFGSLRNFAGFFRIAGRAELR